MKSSVILPFVSLASAICDHRTSLYTRAMGGGEGEVEVATFGYNDLKGPLNWHSHNNASSLCATGTQQSPINLNDTSATVVPGSSLGFDVPSYPHGAVFENLGSTLEVVAQNGTLTRHGRHYKLKQFHFHTPSEHRVESEYFPMEVHFVFEADAELNKNSTGPSASVVGFLIEVDNTKPSVFLANVFSHLDEVAEPGSHAETEGFSLCELKEILARSDVYQYDGSLTTPPCTQGIAWNVVAEPLTVDDATFRAAKKIMKFNARYTQNVPGQKNLLDHSRVVLNSISN
ncbi:carbonic anhydrase [Colletotrichum truncatum]|uniref:Carbonic anhydrase n=1 Tax=Colletotrichum truncatum TaxID=5467 RepID=A0ACC3YIZ4_COLTU|nr:carbonic anhydrase [Colletotrichum truncatum]KAF6797124.1 carbonic anhydrase [Colletotrichum truncatum]